ncbi:MAG: vitamin B12-dependent ribonucleotide reductase, partial [Myxococcota bacterium]
MGDAPPARLTVERLFTTAGQSVWDTVTWNRRDARIRDSHERDVFFQSDVEAPENWSEQAVRVAASKYFAGQLGGAEREDSVRQLIGRVVETIRTWATESGLFADAGNVDAFCDELAFVLLHQMAAFNSPVWFNVGVDPKPQCSACFINSVDDSMESILDLAKTEAMLFKHGSGTGSNFSRLRGREETLSNGGTASGPVSFMRGFDAFAGVIKSGGRTRRAAKMVVLDADHPDIVEFVRSKAREEQKAWALIDAGYDGSIDGEAYGSVAFQNANHSVRFPEDFWSAVRGDDEWQTRFRAQPGEGPRFPARELLLEVAQAAWLCGDPGVQYDDTMQRWHTCKNSGPI